MMRVLPNSSIRHSGFMAWHAERAVFRPDRGSDPTMSPAGGELRGWMCYCRRKVQRRASFPNAPHYLIVLYPPPSLRDTSASGGYWRRNDIIAGFIQFCKRSKSFVEYVFLKDSKTLPQTLFLFLRKPCQILVPVLFENAVKINWFRFHAVYTESITGIIPSASRECSAYQFRCASLSELKFHE